MTKVTVYGLESLDFERTEEYPSRLILKATGDDGTHIVFEVGCLYDDADTIREMLHSAAGDAAQIVDDWVDEPDIEMDGFVAFDGRAGRYYVTLFGKTQDTGYNTQDIAEYELARAMAEAGYFPNAWYQNDRGNTNDIGESVRKYQDEGGDKLLPLLGVEYADGADITADGLSACVVRDYGELGIVYMLSGDDEQRFTEDRSVVKWDDSEPTGWDEH